MSKPKAAFQCRQCGATSTVWSGRCHVCGQWDSFSQTPAATSRTATGQPITTGNITAAMQDTPNRLATSLNQIDEVLGGGLVRGSVVLLAGQPGIGKSTLLMQLAAGWAALARALYISAEESTDQVGGRAVRLQLAQTKLQLAASVSAEDIAATINSGDFEVVVVDSVQALTDGAASGAPGSPSQVTAASQRLLRAAKDSHTALVLVGHVTKEGSIAGPKLLEHMVDVVLQLDGDRYGGLKALRTAKNRYGPTHQTALLATTDRGLIPVSNPSAALLAEYRPGDGSVILAAMEGTRPLLVEIQALVSPTTLAYPRRATSGLDPARVSLLIAMMTRRGRLALADKDVYVNVVGGLRLDEPAADLAVCLAITSAAKGKPLMAEAAVFGELGLGGEIRRVAHADSRLREARKLGLKTIIGPPSPAGKTVAGYRPVAHLNEAIRLLS